MRKIWLVSLAALPAVATAQSGLDALNLDDLTAFSPAPATTAAKEDSANLWSLTGFMDVRSGVRTRDTINQQPFSLGEARVQIQAEHPLGDGIFQVTADGVVDPVLAHHDLNWEKGTGWLDLRTLYVSQQLTDNVDVKLGRQILTWGTGDLLFINDMFPKDWNSFFIGRDEEYLKAPSDALKASLFNDVVNVDLVYTPQFDNDRYIDGNRISYYNGNMGQVVGQNAITNANGRVDAFDEDEWALRAYRNLGAIEAAAYLYHGYWKTPQGQNAANEAYFPALNVWGASVRGPLGDGIANAEVGYYQSTEDNSGTNNMVPNDQLRFLLGYEQELLPELTGAVQWYVERLLDYNAYENALAGGAVKKDKVRQVFTIRLTKLLMNQNLMLSLFNFYSPTDQDGYARPFAQYKISDHWRVEGGGNIFFGNDRNTFFGQFASNSNVYIGIRRSF